MKITGIETFLMNAARSGGGWQSRNWLFVKVQTDEGLYGIGESSGWPRVVQTAIQDLTPILIGADPMHIEAIVQGMHVAMMGHGMTGVVGSGAISGVEMALWDLKGKALGVPVWNLLGGQLRDRVRLYTHAHTPEQCQKYIERGFTAFKTGGVTGTLAKFRRLRQELDSSIDLMADVHGPPWLTVPDAIQLGQALEEFDLLFYEDPVAPENTGAIAEVARHVNLPIAAGERHSFHWGVSALIENRHIDVVQPDTGRAGGLLAMRKIAQLAEAHYVTFAPHDGSLGPVAEIAAAHLCATLPNFLILEHLEDDVPQRYEVMHPQPTIENGHLLLTDAPGLGIDIVPDAIARFPSQGNISPPKTHFYVQAKFSRGNWMEEEVETPGFN